MLRRKASAPAANSANEGRASEHAGEQLGGHAKSSIPRIPQIGLGSVAVTRPVWFLSNLLKSTSCAGVPARRE
jgi:hypothetical protein